MKHSKKHSAKEQMVFEKLASFITRKTGSTGAFLTAFGVVIIWVATGPFFHFSDTWQLVINTGTTIVTFLMVFLIQKTQNKDSIAIQLKLNELIACNEKASNRLVDVEDLSEDELNALHLYFRKLALMTANDTDLHASHSIEEAEELHKEKILRLKSIYKAKK
jgi:low affinity Fe/Cu permease